MKKLEKKRAISAPTVYSKVTISRLSGLPLEIISYSEAEKDPELSPLLKEHYCLSEFSIGSESFCFQDFIYHGKHYVVCTEDYIESTSLSRLKTFYSVDFLKEYKLESIKSWSDMKEKISYYHGQHETTLWEYLPDLPKQ